MQARNSELGLLVLATIITGVAYALTGLGSSSANLPANIVPFLGIVLGLLLVTHLVIRWLAPDADGFVFPLAALLNGMGYMMIARLDPDLASKQTAWTFIGLGAFSATLLLFRDLRTLARYRYSFALLGVVLLMLPLVPGLGKNVNGARIWLQVGPFTIQPGEFAKVILALFLAGYLIDKRELLSLSTRKVAGIAVPNLKHFGPMLLAWGVALVVMVLQRDLGSSLLFFTLFMVMIYIATERFAYVLVGLVLFSSGAYGSWTFFSHVQRRVAIWIDPYADAKGAGFQIAEASFSMADGGLTGTGLGLGTPNKIPFADTDMIFAAFGEEMGLFGATAILILFLMFVGGGFRIASSARSPFESLLAAGLTALLGFQAFIIIGGILRVLPLTGVTLPFVSYGGSSLVANYVILAILIRVSASSKEDELGLSEIPEAERAAA